LISINFKQAEKKVETKFIFKQKSEKVKSEIEVKQSNLSDADKQNVSFLVDIFLGRYTGSEIEKLFVAKPGCDIDEVFTYLSQDS
jgi:hypothetical protein